MNCQPRNFILVLITLLSFVATATAYNVQYADNSKTLPLSWKSKSIPVSFSRSLLNQSSGTLSENNVLQAIDASLSTWENVADIKFEENWSNFNSVSPLGKNGDGRNLITISQTTDNLLLFSGESSENAARTRVFFNRQGKIIEADIVLNPYVQFSTDGSLGTYDLESVLTHEIGHLLGLEHSDIPSSSMFANQGKNGVYNLKSFSPRTLSQDDISAVRSLYGANREETACCGSISGVVAFEGKTPAKTFRVFAEDAESRRFIADVSTDQKGNFIIEGLNNGNYVLYLKSADNLVSAVQEIGKVEVINGKTAIINKKVKIKENNFRLQLAGFNGQIANLAVPLNAGKSYTLYVAGQNLDAENFDISFNSPFIKINPQSFVEHDYGSEISVISFEAIIETNVPMGDYSISFRDKNGNTDYLVGAVSIEEMKNPWFSYIF